MKLYVLRHGHAADAQTWPGSDGDRPLTAEGRERIIRSAKTMQRLISELDLIVTSPLLRARQTAQIVAAALEMNGKLVEDDRLAAGFGIDTEPRYA